MIFVLDRDPQNLSCLKLESLIKCEIKFDNFEFDKLFESKNKNIN